MNINRYKLFIGLLIILFSLVKIERELFVPDFAPDKLQQIQAAYLFIEGKGVSAVYAQPTDLSQNAIKPLSQWPEGYSLFIAPFLKMTGSFFWGTFIPDAIAVLLYILAWVIFIKIFKDQLETKEKVLLLLLVTFSSSPFIYFTSTDLIAYSLFWLSLAILLLGMKKEGRPSYFVLAGIILVSTGLFRYAYIPQVAGVLLSFFAFAIVTKKKKYLFNLLLFSSIVVALGAIYLIFKANTETEIVYIDKSSSHVPLFWNNLSRFDLTVFLKGFMNDSVFYTVLKYFKLLFLQSLFKLIVTFLILSLVLAIIWNMIKSRRLWENESLLLIFLLGITTIGINILMLFYLSLTNKVQMWALEGWTFVQEPRYYAPSFLFLFLFLFLGMNNNFIASKTLNRLCYNVFLFLSALSFSYYIIEKIAEIKNNPKYFSFHENRIGEYGFGYNLEEIKEIVAVNSFKDYKNVIAGFGPKVSLFALVGAIPVKKEEVEQIKISTSSQKVSLFICIPSEPFRRKEAMILRDFCRDRKAKMIREFGDGHVLYQILLNTK